MFHPVHLTCSRLIYCRSFNFCIHRSRDASASVRVVTISCILIGSGICVAYRFVFHISLCSLHYLQEESRIKKKTLSTFSKSITSVQRSVLLRRVPGFSTDDFQSRCCIFRCQLRSEMYSYKYSSFFWAIGAGKMAPD